MYQNSFFPLRTILGDAVPLGKQPLITKTFESAESKNLGIEYDFTLKSSLTETFADPHYYNYLPTFIIDGTKLLPGEGMDTLPAPPLPHPFADDAQVLSFFAISKAKATATDVSRKLSARFSIQLPDKFLIGGICFGGFPFLYSSRERIEKFGEASANFGLPREVRLTCLGEISGDKEKSRLSFEYIDAEISATKQEIISDSGFHFLCIDPTLTNLLTVHFSDYPTILRNVKLDTQQEKYVAEEYYGFIVPYFYIFEYKEKTRYRPQVLAGLLGAKSNHPAGDFKGVTLKNVFSGLIDFKHIVNESGAIFGTSGGTVSKENYFDFTAASVFGQQRDFIVREELYTGKKAKGKIKKKFKECFISQKIKPGEKVVLYIEQGEEYERCVAGLKMHLPFIPKTALKEDAEKIGQFFKEFLPYIPDIAVQVPNVPRRELEKFLRQSLEIPPKIDFCERVGVRVFEIDPTEGVSPVSVPLEGKYATLLAEVEIDRLMEISLARFLDGIKFVRPSNAKFFAVELTNLDDRPGQFVVKKLELVQSAHVSIHPRAAKVQQVRTLNFRIIGSNLAEDYALLGSEGFNFSIERFVAGERKNVLFRANSLLDLLHTGAAKIFSNVRRRAVEFEKSEIYPAYENDAIKYLIPGEYQLDAGIGFTPNYENRYSESRMEGWRRSETGNEVKGKADWKGRKRPGEFENFANQEIRTHSRILFPDASLPEWNSAALFANGMSVIYDGGDVINAALTGNTSNLLLPTYKASDNNNVHQLVKGFSKYWKGIDKGALKVTGNLSISQSPYGFTVTSGQVLNNLVNLFRFNPANPADVAGLVNLLIALGGLTSALMPNSPTQLALLLPTLNGLNLGLSLTVAGAGLAANPAPGTFLPSVSQNASTGTQGSITKQASKSGYIYSQFLNNSYDEGDGYTEIKGGEMKRVLTRKEVPETDRQRVKGAEVMWQGELVDIITGAIPLNFTLPATATKMHYRTADDSLRVRFGSGVGKSVAVDFWFDITEEVVKDDY